MIQRPVIRKFFENQPPLPGTSSDGEYLLLRFPFFLMGEIAVVVLSFVLSNTRHAYRFFSSFAVLLVGWTTFFHRSSLTHIFKNRNSDDKSSCAHTDTMEPFIWTGEHSKFTSLLLSMSQGLFYFTRLLPRLCVMEENCSTFSNAVDVSMLLVDGQRIFPHTIIHILVRHFSLRSPSSLVFYRCPLQRKYPPKHTHTWRAVYTPVGQRGRKNR